MYNPSVKAVVLNRIALVLSFVGLFVSGVLSEGAFLGSKIPCGENHGCDIVARDPSSHALGIPNAYLGFLLYVVLAGLAYWRLASANPPRKALVIAYGLTAIGVLASLVLTYYSLAVIQATCNWCLTSTGAMILLLIVHAMLMQLDPQPQAEPSSINAIMLAVLVLGSLFGLGVFYGNLMSEVNITTKNDPNKQDPKTILPDDAHTYGERNSPVAIVEFGDLLCPLCQEEYPKVKEFVDNHQGRAKYAFRHYPVFKAQGHEQAIPAAIASEIVAEKSLFWPFLDTIYAKSHDDLKDTDGILAITTGLGFDAKKTLDRMRDGKDKALMRLAKDMEDAAKLGVHGTPTFFIIAPGVKTVAVSGENLFEELDGRQYKKFWSRGK